MLKTHLNKKNIQLIAGSTVVCAVIGFGLASTVLQKYKSEGVLSIEMGVTEYKRFAESATSNTTLDQMLKALPPTDTSDSTEIAKQLRDQAGSIKWQTPVPRISKAEAKDLPDVLQKMEIEREKEREKERDKERDKEREKDRVYVGAKISALGNDAAQAQRIASWLGQYFKETAAREALREQIFVWVGDNNQFSERAQERKLKMQFEIQQANARSKALKQVIEQYPQLGKQEQRQVVDVRKDNEKFMSPLAQLVGAETEVIDVKERAAKLDRDIEQQQFAKGFLQQAERILTISATGSAAASGLAKLVEATASTVKTDAQKEKLLSMAGDVSKISARFLSQAQFIVAPSVPERQEQPRPKVLAAVLGLLGLLLACLWVFKDVILNFLKEEPSTDAA